MKSDDKLRDRAREHLKRILQTTALTGAALGLGTDCNSCNPLVCDPMPPPMCAPSSYLQNRVTKSATWQSTDAGALVVSALVSISADSGERVTISTPPKLVRGLLRDISYPNGQLAFSFVPDSGASMVTATIAVDCSSTPKTIKLSFDVTSPAAGKDLGVTFAN